jgi:uncharacterized protein with HEPN domain
MDKGDLDRIKHIKRYCKDIAAAVRRFGESFDVFTRDTDYYNSVSMSIMQIGELSAGLSDGFKDATRTQMPWGLMKGMSIILPMLMPQWKEAIFGKRQRRIYPIF